MPFTPFHIGPGIAIKAFMQGRLSLMVFGSAQIVMDFQPLYAMITGQGSLHGFSHTYIGATLIVLPSAIVGKYFGQAGLYLLRLRRYLPISWWVAFVSAFIGTYSHVFLDSVMHADIAPLAPFSHANGLHGLVGIGVLHLICLVCAVLGVLVYHVVRTELDDRAE